MEKEKITYENYSDIQIKKITIKSEESVFMRPIDHGVMNEKISIDSNGKVKFKSYKKFYDSGEKLLERKIETSINKNFSNMIFDTIKGAFDSFPIYEGVRDAGRWKLIIEYEDGSKEKHTGSLGRQIEYNNLELSELIRHMTGMEDLMLFDGEKQCDYINKIIIEYKHLGLYEEDEYYFGEYGEEDESYEEEYFESLQIDGESGIVTLDRYFDQSNFEHHKYGVDFIDEILDEFDSELFFRKFNTDRKVFQENPIHFYRNTYKIRVKYDSKKEYIIESSFDKDGLPIDFGDFAEAVKKRLDIQNSSILDKSIYGKSRRQQSEYIFCSVEFYGGNRTYYYLTDDETIEVGDEVIVPVGADNHHVTVEVVDVEYFTKENAPYSLDKIKKIFRKC